MTLGIIYDTFELIKKESFFKFWPLHNLFRNLPTDCTISEKSLATSGFIFNSNVITGNATAPPPSEVMPKDTLRSKYFKQFYS